MPIVSDIAVVSASYDKDTGRLTLNGTAFSENQYAGNIYFRKHGTVTWIAADSIVSWADSQSIAIITVALGTLKGMFDARLVNGDNESAILPKAFSIPAGGIFFFFDDDGK